MLAKDIRVGGVYVAKVSNKLTRVRVDEIREDYNYTRAARTSGTRYDVTNLATGRKMTFRSAAKFRSESAPLPSAVEEFFKRSTQVMGNLAGRWRDDEDINDYKIPLLPIAESVGVEIVEMHKRPFGVGFKAEGRSFVSYIKGNQYVCSEVTK